MEKRKVVEISGIELRTKVLLALDSDGKWNAKFGHDEFVFEVREPSLVPVWDELRKKRQKRVST
jgi:hypothetical protein